MLVKAETTPMLPGLSPVRGEAIVVRFDGACMSFDGGLLALQEHERATFVTEECRLALSCAGRSQQLISPCNQAG